ncbi:MAG TPA: CHAT domain-containing protein [Thermoanaerobaculia bacterium]|nr:CHAT domain-containing protein [Thermoanaerobaculia bacterium]
MTGRQALVLSLGLTGATWMGCGENAPPPQDETRPVEPRLIENAVYLPPCRIDEEATDLVPDADCGKRSSLKNKDPKAEFGEALRGGNPAAVSEKADEQVPIGTILAYGGPDDLRRAVLRYQRMTSAYPDDAQTWSELAAIYLVQAQLTDDPRDLLRAYEAANQAVRLDDSLPEARFNEALALERLFLPDAALDAWRGYLSLDSSSGWAKEARERLKVLARPRAGGVWAEQEKLLEQAALAGDVRTVEEIVDRNRQAAREYAEQRLSGDWADAVMAGRQDLAADKLRILRAVGDALASTSRERLVYDTVAAIDAAAGDPRKLGELAQGTRDWRDGYKEYKKGNSQRAELKLIAGRDALRRAGSPLAWRAAFFLASNEYIARRYPQAIAATERLVPQVEGLPYGALRGHVYWIKAASEATLGRTRAAVDDFKQSFDEFKRLGEIENASNVDGRRGEVLTSRGRKSEAWLSIYQALRSTPKLRDPGHLATIYMIAGNAALQDGMDDAALAFQLEWVRQSRLSNSLATVEALTSLARFQHHLGDREGALASLREAESRFGEVEERQQKRRRADLAMTQGLMTWKEDPAGAADLLTSALPVYNEEENLIFALWTLLARGRAYRQAEDDTRAERDFEAALILYGRMGESLEAEDLRLALLEESDTVFDEMVALQAERDPDRAFAYADRARTRVLPGSASKLWTGFPEETSRLLATEPQPVPLSEIRRRLPEKVTLVQFSVLPDRVLIWLVRQDGKGRDFFQQPIRREDLEEMVARLRAFDPKVWDQTSADLFHLLVKPWLPEVAAGERIVIVPDKVLHQVPFSALQDSSTPSRRRLVETHPLAYAPSATLYVNALERQDSVRPDHSRGLVVGEPTVNHNVPGYETLVSLPAAAEEGRQLAAATGARLLAGTAATKSAFLAAAAEAEWIQFSGHALVDPANTLLSKLVLASSDDKDPGALTAREIYSLKLDGTRLVVLAACDTGTEYVPGGEGVTSLARAFLAAGVPTVVASLWSVDDGATAHLFEAFHRNLRPGVDPVDALRAAQLEMLRSRNEKDRSPWTWAAFEVIGASAAGRH